MFWMKGICNGRILHMDLWNNEIVSYSLSVRCGDCMMYISGLSELFEFKKQRPGYRTVLHSDQNSVYASKVDNDLLLMYMVWSMSGGGTPIDNGAMESIDGWIKAELFIDFHLSGEKSNVAPAKGATRMRWPPRAANHCFNSRTREGCDGKCSSSYVKVKKVSIHAPARGATDRPNLSGLSTACFNSRTREGCDGRGNRI